MPEIAIKKRQIVVLLTTCFLLSIQLSKAQIVEIGFKGGAMASWMKIDDPQFKQSFKMRPIMGYSVGPALSFKVKNRYFLHSEYLLTVKGRRIKGKTDPMHNDKMVNTYIEVPLTYNVLFSEHLKLHGEKLFKVYLGLGPNFQYWLSGRGTIYSGEHNEGNLPREDYKIMFGKRGEDFVRRDEVYIDNVRKLQLGLLFGGGMMTEPDAKHRVMVDFRFEYGHSWLAKGDGYQDFVIPQLTRISTQARNMSARISAIYMMEVNTNKKFRNKGKSNSHLKKKHR